MDNFSSGAPAISSCHPALNFCEHQGACWRRHPTKFHGWVHKTHFRCTESVYVVSGCMRSAGPWVRCVCLLVKIGEDDDAWCTDQCTKNQTWVHTSDVRCSVSMWHLQLQKIRCTWGEFEAPRHENLWATWYMMHRPVYKISWLGAQNWRWVQQVSTCWLIWWWNEDMLSECLASLYGPSFMIS